MVATIQTTPDVNRPVKKRMISLFVVCCWLLVTMLGLETAYAVECTYSTVAETDPFTGQSFALNQVRPEGFTLQGQGLTVTDPSQCRFRDATGDVWYVVSGSVCMVQGVITRAMFQVYCGIMLEITPLLTKFIALYIMLYATAILFGLNQVNGRELTLRAVKLGVVIAFVSNADFMYFYMYEFFLNFIDDFSNILLSFEPLYDADGNVAISLEYTNITAQSPTEILWASNGGKCIEADPHGTGFPLNANAYPTPSCTCTTNVVNWGVCPPSNECGFVSSANTTGTPVPEFCSKNATEMAACLNSIGSAPHPNAPAYCGGAFEVASCNIPQAPTDQLGRPIWHIDGNGYLQPNTDPTNGRPLEYYNGGVFAKIDVIFRAIVGSSEESNFILLLAMAIAATSNTMGFVLVALSLLGIVAAFAAFANVMVTYLTALISVAFLLMFTPIFFVLFLYGKTQVFFFRWLQNIISYSLQPIMILAFLYGASELASVQSLWIKLGDAIRVPTGNGSGYEIPIKNHNAGWEGFWELNFSGPKINNPSCTYIDADGKEQQGSDCVKQNYCEYDGKAASNCIKDGSTISCIDTNGQCQVNCQFFEADVVSFVGMDGILRPKRDKHGRIQNPEIPAASSFICDPNNDGVPDETCIDSTALPKSVVKPAMAIVVAWLLISAIVGGFMSWVPQIAQRITKTLGSSFGASASSTAIGATAKGGEGISFDAGQYDQGSRQVYTIGSPIQSWVAKGKQQIMRKGGVDKLVKNTLGTGDKATLQSKRDLAINKMKNSSLTEKQSSDILNRVTENTSDEQIDKMIADAVKKNPKK